MHLPIIYNGHSELTKGKQSPILPDGRQLFEWEFNFKVVTELKKMLDEEGIQAYYLNPSPQDSHDPLTERINDANKIAAEAKKNGHTPYGLSIHANAGPAGLDGWTDEKVKGAETWYFPTKKNKHGKILAEIFQRHIVTETGMKDRGLKCYRRKADGTKYTLYWNRKTNFPAVLTENGFFNNPIEVLDLLREEFIEKVAQAHFCAIMEIEQNGF